jgi:hypothetical protein
MQAIKDVYKSDRAMTQAVCRQLPHKPGFDLSSVSVGFVVDKLALRPVYIREIPFSPASLIPPTLRAIFCSCSRLPQIANYLKTHQRAITREVLTQQSNKQIQIVKKLIKSTYPLFNKNQEKITC